MSEVAKTHEPNVRFQAITWMVAFVIASIGFFLPLNHDAWFLDFNVHYVAGIVERHGGTYLDTPALRALSTDLGLIYPADGVYGTPALVAIIFMPLSILSVNVAQATWIAVCSAALAIATRKALADSNRWPFWLGLAVMSPALRHSETLANPSTLTFSLILFCFGALRSRQNNRAGVALGIAIALKAYPAFLLVVFIARRDWKTARTAIVTVVAIYAATLVVLGPKELFDGLEFLVKIAGQVTGYKDNASIPGILVQLFDNETLASVAGKVLITGAAVLVFALCRNLPAHLTLAVAAMLMLAAQSLSWKNYFALAFIGLIAMRDLKPSRNTWIVAGTLFLAAADWSSYIPGVDLAGPISNSLQSGGAIGLAILILVVARRHATGINTLSAATA